MPSTPRSRWDCTFTDQGDTTLIQIVSTYDKLAELEQILEMGSQGGFTAGLENLDAYLNTHNSTGATPRT